MQLSKLTLAITMAILGFANAAPAPEMGSRAEARDIIYLGHAGYAWEHSNQYGERWTLTTVGSCHSLIGEEHNDRISSIQVDTGIVCKFYKNFFCDKDMLFGQGGVVETHGPYTGNVPPGWHDVISSYRCYNK